MSEACLCYTLIHVRTEISYFSHCVSPQVGHLFVDPMGIHKARRNLSRFIGSSTQKWTLADAASGKVFALCNLMCRLGKDKFRIELLEELPFASADQARAVELKYTPKSQISDVSSG